MRTTLQQLAATSAIPEVIGCCATDYVRISAAVNRATPRLLQDRAFGETGPWGTWRRVVFNVDPLNPYLAVPREVARIVNLDLRRTPATIWNEWYEVLEAGPGLQDGECCDSLSWNWSWPSFFGWGGCSNGSSVFDRGTTSTAFQLSPTNQKLRVYLTDARDLGKRVLISGAVDQNGQRIYTQDGLSMVDGFYLILDSPFATSTFIVTDFKGVIKDFTYGDVILKQVDATTGAEVQLARYAPDELTPSYRKYFFKSLPKFPVSPATTPATYTPIQVTAMCKLEFIPIIRATDFLLIANDEALTEEVQSLRYAKIDNTESQKMGILHHQRAIQLLKNELTHYLGNQQPSITMRVAGLEGLWEQRIGSLV